MHVKMGHALADNVVHRDEGAHGFHRVGDGGGEASRHGEQRTDERYRQIRQRGKVLLGYQEGVTCEKRSDIKEREELLVLENDMGIGLAGNYRTESAHVIRE